MPADCLMGSYGCPCCTKREYDARREADRQQYEFERRSWRGQVTRQERIRRAWDRYKDQADWSRIGAFRVADMPPMRLSYRELNEPTHVSTHDVFEFHRTVRQERQFTVTRISCDGMTLEEHVQ